MTEFKHLGILFICKLGKDKSRIGAVATAMPSLYRSIVVKKVIGSFFTSTFPPSSRGVLGMEETPGKTPDMSE